MVYVGDSPLDVVAARLAGIRCVVVATGAGGKEALAESGFTAPFDTLAASLPSILGETKMPTVDGA